MMPRYDRAPLSKANTVNNNKYGSGYRLPCARRGSGTSAKAARRLENATMAPSRQGARHRFRLFRSWVDSFADRQSRSDSYSEHEPLMPGELNSPVVDRGRARN